MTITNWIALAAVVITFVTSNVVVARQVRKAKKAKWIDDFREEISEFLTLSIAIIHQGEDTKYNTENFLKLDTISIKLSFLLNENDKDQDNLNSMIMNTVEFILSDEFNIETAEGQEYFNMRSSIKLQAKSIIKKELKSYNSFF
ncbi:hypothetical protein EON73_03535 [bacterium]|nr:MAG: hypothetical protein EON73_03535 [bacterium]